MALGKNQKAQLDSYAKSMSGGEPKTLVVKVHPWRRFTREMGGGSGYPITIFLYYKLTRDKDDSYYLSTCRYKHSVDEKLREVKTYLERQGMNLSHLRIEGW